MTTQPSVDIDRHAPVSARGEVVIDASRDTIWSLLSDIERWPAWSRDIASATLHGPLAPGSAFTWKAGPGAIRSTLIAIESGELMAWTGSTMGIRAVHVWRIAAIGDKVSVVTEESWSGLLASLLRRAMRRRLQASIDDGLDHLKAEAERRAAEGSAR